jgi:Ca-activated chloride channel family protein
LRQDDFELRDNGVLQRISLVDAERTPLHVVLVLDTSASLAGERITFLRTAARMLVTRLSPEDRVSLVSFGQAVTIHAEQSSKHSAVTAMLDSFVAAGPTALVDAVAGGLSLSDPALGRSLGVVFSDGVDTTSWLNEKTVLEAAIRSDLVVYGVSTRRGRDNGFLRALTEGTGGRLFEIASVERLAEAFHALFEEFRMRYILMYTPEGVTRTGWHTLDVRVRGDASVNARRGYYSSR